MEKAQGARPLPALTPPLRHIDYLPGAAAWPAPLAIHLTGLAPEARAAVAAVLRAAGASLCDVGGDGVVELRFVEGPGLPEAGRAAGESYELEIGPGCASARGPRPGLWWAAQSLAALLRARPATEWPAVRIRDWPDMAARGIFVEDKWGPDRMGLADWQQLVDRLASAKMNRLGIGLYGCWGSCRFEPGEGGLGWPTEFLMVPVPGHPQLASRKRLRWYSPAGDQWHDETYLPRMFQEDFLADLVDYAAARGVTVVPFVNSYGHNTLIPRLRPELSAKNEDGSPRRIGYCLSDPATRAFIEQFYGAIVTRYYGGSAPFFHVQMDEVWPDNPDPERPQLQADPWCQCAQCRARRPEELLQDYVVWLVEMLTSRGVGTVVMWNDQLTRHMDALDAGLVARLRQQGLDQRLILHWWWYDNDALNDRTRVAIGRRLGLSGWVAPMTCYYNWMTYNTRLPNIDLMLGMAKDEGAEGAVSYAVHDPAWADHESLLASHAWNGAATSSWQEQVPLWADTRFGRDARAYLAAMERLRQAVATPALGRCHHYMYTYARAEGVFPRPYPGEALQGLAGVTDAGPQLRRAAELGRQAAADLAAVAAGRRGEDRATPASLWAEAARTAAVAAAFAALLEVWQQAEKGKLGPVATADLDTARRGLLEAMRIVEREKPVYVVPACLQSLSVLLAFMDQLSTAIAAVQAGGRPLSSLTWSLVSDGGRSD